MALRLPQPWVVRHVRPFFCSALDGGDWPKPKALPPALALAEWAPHVRDMLRPLGDASCVPREVRHMLDAVEAPVQEIQDPVLEGLGVKLSLKRDDLIHPDISGNKWRKLKYNVLFAATRGESLLTFGGAFSVKISSRIRTQWSWNVMEVRMRGSPAHCESVAEALTSARKRHKEATGAGGVTSAACVVGTPQPKLQD